MDHKEFDELVARIAKAASRREAVKGLVGGALAAAGIGGAAADDAEAKGQGKKRGRAGKEGRGPGKQRGRGGPKAEACLANNAKCDPPQKRQRRGKKKKAKLLGCDRCCSGLSKPADPGSRANRVCACIDSGSTTTCTNTKQCCSGLCSSGVCQSLT